LRISDVLKIDFVFAPTAEAARPLWRPFLCSALGVLVLEESEPVMRLAKYCAFELRLPIVVATGHAAGGLNTAETLPALLRGAPAGAALVNTDVAGAVRALLLAAMHTSGAEPPEALAAAGEG
jgi:hypothetical protein